MRSYDEAGEAIDRILERGGDADEVLRGVVQALAGGFEHYAWVGIYFVEEGELALGPRQGSEPPDEWRIPIGRGVCGGAAASGETRVIDENRAAFDSTRAQIAVPTGRAVHRPCRRRT